MLFFFILILGIFHWGIPAAGMLLHWIIQKNVHSWELKWKAPSSVPCGIFCCDQCCRAGKQTIQMHYNYRTAGLFYCFIFRYCNLCNLIKGTYTKLIWLAVSDIFVNFRSSAAVEHLSASTSNQCSLVANKVMDWLKQEMEIFSADKSFCDCVSR